MEGAKVDFVQSMSGENAVVHSGDFKTSGAVNFAARALGEGADPGGGSDDICVECEGTEMASSAASGAVKRRARRGAVYVHFFNISYTGISVSHTLLTSGRYMNII